MEKNQIPQETAVVSTRKKIKRLKYDRPKYQRFKNWSRARRFARAGAHIQLRMFEDQDQAVCRICGEAINLTAPFVGTSRAKKLPESNRASRLLNFTRDHFYKHNVGAQFTKFQPCGSCAGSGIWFGVNSETGEQHQMPCEHCSASGVEVVSL